MKQIRINFITPVNRKMPQQRGTKKNYVVRLGNGYHGFFNSRREALGFLADANRQFNFWMLELNRILVEGFTLSIKKSPDDLVQR